MNIFIKYTCGRNHLIFIRHSNSVFLKMMCKNLKPLTCSIGFVRFDTWVDLFTRNLLHRGEMDEVITIIVLIIMSVNNQFGNNTKKSYILQISNAVHVTCFKEKPIISSIGIKYIGKSQNWLVLISPMGNARIDLCLTRR